MLGTDGLMTANRDQPPRRFIHSKLTSSGHG
jgi:hypothetical protein